METEKFEIKQLLPALGFSIFAGMAGFIGYTQAPQAGEMAVVFPPWEDSNRAVAKVVTSGAKFVSPSKLPSIFVVQIDSEQTKQQLHDAGAIWFVAAKGICGPLEDAVRG